MRRGTYHLCRVFAHCHDLQQVIDITERRPRQIAKAPGEERAYQKHVSQQRQFDEERQAFGLDPRSPAVQNNTCQPTVGAAVVDNAEPESGPPSIFATQFAGLADSMQSILDEKDAKARSEPQINIQGPSQGGQTQYGEQGRVQKVPDATSSNTIISQPRNQLQTTCPELLRDRSMQVRPNVQSGSPDQPLPRPSLPAVNHTPESRHAQQPNVALTSQTATTPIARGLMQSIWSNAPQVLPGNMSKSHDESMVPAQPTPPAARRLPARSEQANVQSSHVGGRAHINVTKAKESNLALPSGSSWW